MTGSLSNPLDDDSYLDRPTGLLTRTDVAWLADKINAADASVARVTTIAGPTAVYVNISPFKIPFMLLYFAYLHLYR